MFVFVLVLILLFSVRDAQLIHSCVKSEENRFVPVLRNCNIILNVTYSESQLSCHLTV